jgi:hypothetical protein
MILTPNCGLMAIDFGLRLCDHNCAPTRARDGLVRVASNTGFQRGVSALVVEVGAWLTTYDSDSGWVWVGARPQVDDDDQVLIATDTVLGLRSGHLNSV